MMIRRSILLLFFAILAVVSHAQQASFVYIQGDKKTPFYVKMNGEMQPRYGKHYAIIPELLPGVINIEVLFQQNTFPAHKFAIKVPQGGQRGFLLVEKSGSFSLYDLEQGIYLASGNDSADDFLPPSQPVVPVAAQTRREDPPVKSTLSPKPKRTEKPSQNSTAPAQSGPQFIPDLQLGSENGTTSSPGVASGNGCGEPMDVPAFSSLYRSVLDIEDQDERLVFLNKRAEECYSVTQIRLLARVLDRDAARYTFLKKIKGHLNNADRFKELEDLLSAESYKSRFRELLSGD